jgi:hypothetical protein
MHCLWLMLCYNGRVKSCQSDHMTYTAKNSYYIALHKKFVENCSRGWTLFLKEILSAVLVRFQWY